MSRLLAPALIGILAGLRFLWIAVRPRPDGDSPTDRSTPIVLGLLLVGSGAVVVWAVT